MAAHSESATPSELCCATWHFLTVRLQAALSTAEGLAREHTAKFNASGDKRSEAVLLLAAGEINYNKRGANRYHDDAEFTLTTFLVGYFIRSGGCTH